MDRAAPDALERPTGVIDLDLSLPLARFTLEPNPAQVRRSRFWVLRARARLLSQSLALRRRARGDSHRRLRPADFGREVWLPPENAVGIAPDSLLFPHRLPQSVRFGVKGTGAGEKTFDEAVAILGSTLLPRYPGTVGGERQRVTLGSGDRDGTRLFSSMSRSPRSTQPTEIGFCRTFACP
jgi:hypothetical protein